MLRLICASPFVIPGAVIALGIALLIRGFCLPEYSDPKGRDLLFNKSWDEHEEVSRNLGSIIDQWEALNNRILTHRHLYIDYGFSSTALGAGVLAIFVAKKIRKWGDVREMMTPKSRGLFYAYAAVVWLSFAPAQIFFPHYNSDVEGPPWDERMNAPETPMEIFMPLLVSVPIVLFGVWLCARRRSMPVPIWSGPISGRFGVVNVLVWIALPLSICVTAGCIVKDPPLVPSCVFTIYLLLCGQALSASPAQIQSARGFEVIMPTGKRDSDDI